MKRIVKEPITTIIGCIIIIGAIILRIVDKTSTNEAIMIATFGATFLAMKDEHFKLK